MAELRKEEEYKFKKSTGIVLYPELIRFAGWVGKKIGGKITVDGLDIQETPDGLHLKNNAKGGGVVGTRDHPYRVSIAGAFITVSANSKLYSSLAPSSSVTITGLNTALEVVAGNRVWLEIAWSDWPDDYTASIEVGPFTTPISDNGGSPPRQTYARIVIANIIDLGGVLGVEQLVINHLRFDEYMDAGLFAIYAYPA